MRLASHPALILCAVVLVLPALGATAVGESGDQTSGARRQLQMRVRASPGGASAEGTTPRFPVRILDQPLTRPNGAGPTPAIATLDGEHRGAVSVPVPSRFRVKITVPVRGRLTFSLDLFGAPPVPRLVDFEVRVLRGDEPEVRFRHPRPCHEAGWTQHEVDLQELAGQEVQLEFQVRGRRTAAVRGATALWGEPILDAGPAATRPDILYLVVDSLRADAVGRQVAGSSITPTLDSLAAEGVLFERVIATSPCADPAALTLLTGRYPSDVWPQNWSARRRSLGLRPGVPTLAGVLRDHGYFTVGLSDHALINGIRFGRGFDLFVDLQAARSGRPTASSSRRLWNRLRGTLSDLPEGGLFTYLHLVHPSPPHDPPALYQQLHRPSAPSPDDTKTAPSSERSREKYEADVRFTDDWIALILALFEELDRTPDLVVVTGTFGLGFAEHRDLTGAGNSLYNELLHVPWIVHSPGRVEPGRCPSLVSTADVVPTLLDLVSIDATSFAGRSALPLLSGEEPDQRLAYSEFPLSPFPSGRAIQSAQWKLILPRREATVFQVFRMDADPGERAPLDPSLAETEEVKDRLWDEVLRIVRQAARTRAELAPEEGD